MKTDDQLELEKAQQEITRLENEALDFMTILRRKVEDNARLRDSALVWRVEALRMGTEVTRLTGIIDEVQAAIKREAKKHKVEPPIRREEEEP